MIMWYAVFEDSRQDNELVEEVDVRELRAGVLKRFEDARTANKINGRKTMGMWMWMIDYATEQSYVIKIHGCVPGDIKQHFIEHEGRIARTGPRK